MTDEGRHGQLASPDELRARLDQERSRVVAQIAALRRDLDDIIERSSDASRDDEHDPEGSTIAFERAQVSALLGAAVAKEADIDLAEERIAAGEHSTCEACGATIARERQLARPTARTCISCAST